jgi:hypothetical protein
MSSSAVRLRVALLVLIGLPLTGCSGLALETNQEPAPAAASPTLIPTSVPTPAAMDSPQPTSDTIATRYGFPTKIDPAARYLFYLHGKIIEGVGLPAVDPVFGEYRYQEILESLESYGFVVVSEQRPKNTDGMTYAMRVAGQVNELMRSGVPPESITVVGASKGAAIAAAVSYLVDSSETNYVLLGACHPDQIDALEQLGVVLSGNVLAIRDEADTEYSGSCEELFARSEGQGLGRHAEVVLQVGTGHGILYQPLAEWIVPTIQWANQEW